MCAQGTIKSHTGSDLVYASLKIGEDLFCIVVGEESGEILDHISAIPVQRQSRGSGIYSKIVALGLLVQHPKCILHYNLALTIPGYIAFNVEQHGL